MNRDIFENLFVLEMTNNHLGQLERALKIAIPVTCIVIALFGAPLATSNQRGGAAYGIAISLATTVTFLMAVQVTKAIVGTGILPPDVASEAMRWFMDLPV